MAILKNLQDYFLNSSLHGLHFIADKRYHWTERLFWIICVLGSWGASLVLMLNAIDQYQTQKISFSVDTSYLSWKTNFPSIVLCESSNPSRMQVANENLFGNYSLLVASLEKFVFYDGTMKYSDDVACGIQGNLRNRCLLGNYSSYMRSYRSSCSEIMTSCNYNGEEFPCCDDFMPIDTYHGPCFAFNSLHSGKYKTREELSFKIDRRIEYGYGNLSIELLHAGFNVYGLSQDAVPTKDSDSDMLIKSLRPNVTYKVFLSTVETFTDADARLMPIENRGCRFDDENDLKYSKIYSMSACENECLVKAQNELCNCTVHTMLHYSRQAKECDYDGLACTIAKKTEIVQEARSCSCISSCFEAQVNKIGQTNADKKMKNVAAHIEFIVQPPTIRYQRSVVKDPLYILVSIGGTVGLFVGASVLTIVEVTYYLIVRPIGGKYLDWRKNRIVQKSKLKELNTIGNCYFEYVN